MTQKRNVLIVGATGAMGSRLARKLASDSNVQLILLARNIQKLGKLSDELPNDPILIPLNLLGATPNDYEAIQIEIEKTCGELHGIVFAAGELGSLAPLEHYGVGQWYNIMQVNVHAPFLMLQSFYPVIKNSKQVNIVFLHDETAKESKAYWGAYTVAEAAKLQLANLLEQEMPSHIKVHRLFLSRFKSSITQKAFPGMFLEGSNPFPEADIHVDTIVQSVLA